MPTYFNEDTRRYEYYEAIDVTGPSAQYCLLGDYPRPDSLSALIDRAPVHEGLPPRTRRLRHAVHTWSRDAVSRAGEAWRRMDEAQTTPCTTCSIGVLRPYERARRYVRCEACRASVKRIGREPL